MPFNSFFRITILCVIWFVVPAIVILFYPPLGEDPALTEYKDLLRLIYYPITLIIWLYWDSKVGLEENKFKQ